MVIRLVSLDCTIYLLGVGVFTTQVEVSRLIDTCIYVHYLRLGHAWLAPSIMIAVTDCVGDSHGEHCGKEPFGTVMRHHTYRPAGPCSSDSATGIPFGEESL